MDKGLISVEELILFVGVTRGFERHLRYVNRGPEFIGDAIRLTSSAWA